MQIRDDRGVGGEIRPGSDDARCGQLLEGQLQEGPASEGEERFVPAHARAAASSEHKAFGFSQSSSHSDLVLEFCPDPRSRKCADFVCQGSRLLEKFRARASHFPHLAKARDMGHPGSLVWTKFNHGH